MKTANLVAVAQLNSQDDVEKNIEACERVCAQAARAGARLLSLPECFAFFARSDGEAAARAEPLTGPWFSRYRAMAAKHGLWLSCGGFPEAALPEALPEALPTEGARRRCYNAHVLLNSTGEIVAHYRKIHLFDVQVGNTPYRESAATAAGDSPCVANTPLGYLGLTVCYDLRFGGLFQSLAQAGAHAMLVPAAFTLATGKEHWEVLLRARAIEHQCYVLAAAQTGRHNDKRDTYGHAMIVDPWGTVVAQCRDGEGVCVAELDVAWIEQVRARMPCASHRREDAYAGAPASAPHRA
jgi:deaminated glutathione amidase